MDQDEKELWQAKLEQKRQVRAQEYERCLMELNARGLVASGSTPILLYKVATQNLGNLNIMWRDILQGSWGRPGRDPDQQAREDREAIERIIENEQNLVHAEIIEILKRKGIAHTEDILKSGKEELAASSKVLKGRCLVMVENFRQERQAQLVRENEDRAQKRIDRLINLGSLVVGAIIALFSVWLTNQWNRETLDPQIELGLGERTDLGILNVKNDIVQVALRNAGPNDVESLELYLTTFYAPQTLNEIQPPAYPLRPALVIDSLPKGKKEELSIGSDGRFKWENIFLTEERDRKNDPKLRGKLLFLRALIKYRRSADGKTFKNVFIFHATRRSLVPWNMPRTAEDFLGGYPQN